MERAVSTTTRRLISNLAMQLQRRTACVMSGWKHRKGLALLAKFDDRALADIGLTRADLYDALAQRMWDDPTEMLERRRAARRDNRWHSVGGGEPKISPPRQMLGVPGLQPPPTDRPARYLV
jgi:uncharacterized protein YjiS (DUF1127 family)